MEWIAIPFAAATVVATFAGGALGLRMAHSLPTLLALTGGVVVAVALFDVLPEAFESLDDPGQVQWLLIDRTLATSPRDQALLDDLLHGEFAVVSDQSGIVVAHRVQPGPEP